MFHESFASLMPAKMTQTTQAIKNAAQNHPVKINTYAKMDPVIQLMIKHDAGKRLQIPLGSAFSSTIGPDGAMGVLLGVSSYRICGMNV